MNAFHAPSLYSHGPSKALEGSRLTRVLRRASRASASLRGALETNPVLNRVGEISRSAMGELELSRPTLSRPDTYLSPILRALKLTKYTRC